MKRALLSLFLLVSLQINSQAQKQSLWLYSVNGEVEVFSSSGWSKAVMYQSLSKKDSLRFGAYASASILDRDNDKLYAVQGKSAESVGDLLQEAEKRSKKQTKGFVAFLWESLRGMNDSNAFRISAGVVYRNDDVTLALASAVAGATSSLPVDFAIIDSESGNTVDDAVSIGQTAVFKVNNYSSMDLYVNILDIDAEGNIAPCIPVSSTQTMSQLLIPANSSVILSSFPIVFTGPKGIDKLILVASPEWFDVEALVNAVQNGDSVDKQIDTGIWKKYLRVE